MSMTTIFIKTKDVHYGNGRDRVWALGYPFLSVQNLKVTVRNPAGYEAYVHKHLRFDSENACVIYPTAESDLQPLGEGWALIIEREAPVSRDIESLRVKEGAGEIPMDFTPLEQLARVEGARAVKSCKKAGEK